MRKSIVLITVGVLFSMVSISLADDTKKQQYLNEQLYKEISLGYEGVETVEKMQKWVDAGADINAKFKEEREGRIESPLKRAVENALNYKNFSALHFLLKKGADVNIRLGNLKTTDFGKEKDLYLDGGQTLLMHAASINSPYRVEVLKLLLEYGADPNATLTFESSKNTPVQDRYQPKAVEFIHSVGPKDPFYEPIRELMKTAMKLNLNSEQLATKGLKRRIADLEQENKLLRSKLSTLGTQPHNTKEEKHR